MSKRQLFLVYSLVTFILVWGFALVNQIKFDGAINVREILSPFLVSQAIYIMVAFVLTGIIFRRFLPSHRYLYLVFGLIGVMLAFIIVRYAIEQVIYPSYIGASNYPASVTLLYYALDNTYYSAIYIAIGAGIALLDIQSTNQKKQAQLLQQNKEAELQFLRSQINPHFLFNTLNNIYSLVYEQSPKAPPAVLQLSELMRYMLYEKKDTVALSREWDYIKSFITLQQLRFNSPLPLEMEAQPEPGSQPIPPYLLIPFIENAFKHGDFRDPSVPLQIKLLVTEKDLAFEVINKVGTQQKDKTGGVGLENVRRRLELLYPGKFELRTNHQGEKFSAYLHLQF